MTFRALAAGMVLVLNATFRPALPSPQAAGLNPACTPYPAPPVPTAVRTLYVNAQGGNDAGNGLTPATAWRTLDRANNQVQPGDHVVLSGTFANQWIRPAKSGTAQARIVYASAPNDRAVLQGGRYDVMVELSGRSYIVVDGVELTQDVDPFRLQNGSHHNWLRNLYVHDAGGSNIQFDATNNRVEDSRFERIGNEASNTGDAIFLADGANRNIMVRNTVDHAGHGAIWISHHNANNRTADDNVIAHNRVFNPWASGIGLNGTANRTILECNLITGTAAGAGSNYPRDGIEIEGTDNIVRFNTVIHSGDEGISIEGWMFKGKVQHAIGNHIHNNTIWSNGGAGINLVIKQGAVRNNTIENNIFWGNRGSTEQQRNYAILIDLYNADHPWPSEFADANVFRHNLFETGLGFVVVTRRAGTDTYSLREAEQRFFGWTGNRQDDPRFMNASRGDFRLAPTSPAIDAGRTIEGGLGGRAPDLGAWESR